MTTRARTTELGITCDSAPGLDINPSIWIRRLEELGIGHFRAAFHLPEGSDLTHLRRNVLACRDIATAYDVTVALSAPLADLKVLVETLLEKVEPSFSSIEIAPATYTEADRQQLAVLCQLIRSHGAAAVLRAPIEVDQDNLRWIVAGLHIDAILFEANVSQAQKHITTLASWLAELQSSLPLWIAANGEVGDDVYDVSQSHEIVQALVLPVARVYWPGADGATTRGLYSSTSAPRLAARLLAGGIDALEQALANPAPAIVGRRPILVTGGAGFIGANLADRLAASGHDVLVYDALSRPGVERNLAWLKQRHQKRVAVAIADVRDERALTDAVKSADAVFHLAAQVAVTTSLVSPLQDFEINVRGTITVLEALRRFNSIAPVVFASTNKVYGDLADIPLAERGGQYLPDDSDLRARGIDETRSLCFHTPYGCSKGAADQYVLDYAHSYGLRSAVLRMSCIYGERQFGTEDQGWLAHFLLQALAGEQITIYGNGRQVRDVLHIDDAIDAYIAAWQNIDRVSGQAFNLGGGPQNAISLLQLIDHIQQITGDSVDVRFEHWRPGDQRYFVADASRLRNTLALKAPLGWRPGVARLATHFGARTISTHEREAAF